MALYNDAVLQLTNINITQSLWYYHLEIRSQIEREKIKVMLKLK